MDLIWKTYFALFFFLCVFIFLLRGSQVSALAVLSQHSLASIHHLGPLYCLLILNFVSLAEKHPFENIHVNVAFFVAIRNAR